jgi:hypothetical protein
MLTKSQRALENISSKNISPTERVFKPVESDFNTHGWWPIMAQVRNDHLSKDSEIEGYLEGFAQNKGWSIYSRINWGWRKTDRICKGGESRVNEAGNYTKPGMRKALFERIKAGGKGGAPGQWSARKAQMLAQQYKKSGGGYKD